MNIGDICEVILQADSSDKQEICLILSEPETVRVGAWGYQPEVSVLCRGKEMRIPTYFLRKLE